MVADGDYTAVVEPVLDHIGFSAVNSLGCRRGVDVFD